MEYAAFALQQAFYLLYVIRIKKFPVDSTLNNSFKRVGRVRIYLVKFTWK